MDVGHCLVVDDLCAKLAGRQKPNGGLVEWLACKLNVIERDRGSMYVCTYSVCLLHVCVHFCVHTRMA